MIYMLCFQINIDYIGIGSWQIIFNMNVWSLKKINQRDINLVDKTFLLTVPIYPQARSRTVSIFCLLKCHSSAGAENMSSVWRRVLIHVRVPMLHHCHTPASTLMQISLGHKLSYKALIEKSVQIKNMLCTLFNPISQYESRHMILKMQI